MNLSQLSITNHLTLRICKKVGKNPINPGDFHGFLLVTVKVSGLLHE